MSRLQHAAGQQVRRRIREGGVSDWPFGDIPMFGHRVILADPPWRFENWSEAGEGRNPNQHYDCMSIADIKALPVGHLAARDCVLFCWVIDPLLPEALDVIRHWGFTYVTVGFAWAKQNRSGEGWFMGTGYYTRANPEVCLIARMGAPGLPRSEEHTSELQSLMRISYAVFCLKKKNK